MNNALELAKSLQPYRWGGTSTLLDAGREHFPYLQFYRGSYRSDIPIVLDRQAGFRPREIPDVPHTKTPYYPAHCFEPAASTIYPCYPECTKEAKFKNPHMNKYTRLYFQN